MDKRIIEAAEAALQEKRFKLNQRGSWQSWTRPGAQPSGDFVHIYPEHGLAEVNVTIPLADLPALLNYQATAEALRWLVNIACGVGKAGGAPEPGEFEAAVEVGKAVLAAIALKEVTP